MINRIDYSFATEKDIPALKKLLSECGLPFEDIDGHITHFILAKEYNTLVGSIGLEQFNHYALVRSLAVQESFRGEGIAQSLLSRLNEYAIQHDVHEYYLLTTTAEHYFIRKGFRVVERNSLPIEIKTTQAFTTLCPSTAICMYKNLNK